MTVKSIKERFEAKRAATKQSAADLLPVVTGPGPCPDCWTGPGQQHQLSCEQVSFEQFMAVLDGAK